IIECVHKTYHFDPHVCAQVVRHKKEFLRSPYAGFVAPCEHVVSGHRALWGQLSPIIAEAYFAYYLTSAVLDYVHYVQRLENGPCSEPCFVLGPNAAAQCSKCWYHAEGHDKPENPDFCSDWDCTDEQEGLD